MRRALCLLFFVIALWAAPLSAAELTDDAGQKLSFPTPPAKVVSLVPSATEIICAIGAGEALAGVTYHDRHLPCLNGQTVVGGAFSPRYGLINALKPDLLIVAPRDFESARAGRGAAGYPILVWHDGVSLAEAETRVAWLGQVFQRPDQAREMVEKNKRQLDLIARKLSKIPDWERPRVMRLMLTPEGLLTPGRDSFLTEMIAAAGGRTPDFGAGTFVPVTLEKWLEFQPDYVFDCGTDHAELVEFLKRDQWREVPAVKHERLLNFPCELTCRAAANTGYFVSWLAASINTRAFANLDDLVEPQEIIAQRPLELGLPYVKSARVVDSRLMDFVHRTVLIDFHRPQTIISTSGGHQTGVETVGNSYSPTPTWPVYHQLGFEKSMDGLYKILKLDRAKSNLLLTGADMNNLVVKTAEFKDLSVTVLVTAGVEGNALRSSRDVGAYYEPGTINIIALTNHQLSPAATARALITITEAKTAALWDMDIRSVQTPLTNPATGTGTDDIIVVAGEGPEINFIGGHSKMGQLLAEAVHAGVREAINRQNGKAPVRSVFERLNERGLTMSALLGGPDCPCQEDADDFQRELEALLLNPHHQGFLQAAFSLSDARTMGQLTDLYAFDQWALATASSIAGQPVPKIEEIISRPDLPTPLRTALNALGTGLKHRP